MARRGWLGLGEIAARAGIREQHTGLVLSGGGAKASFQIGALRHLYRVGRIEPDTIIGTSAGAILAAMLAQGADAESQAQQVEQLARLWLAMEQQSDMFVERSWFSLLRRHVPQVQALVNKDTPEVGAPPGSLADRWEDLVESADTPELATLAVATADPSIPAPELNPAQVVGLLSGLGRLRGLGTDLGQIRRGAERTRSMYVPGPLLRELLGTGIFQSRRVASSGVRTRIAMVALESGELRFMREDGVLVDRDDQPTGEGPFDFSRGVLCSCSIPAVFAPVPMGREHYVDGGVRENLPAEMAMNLGCTTTYVVTSNAPGVHPSGSFAGKDIVSVVMRASELQSDETERDEAAYARSAGAVLIEPEIEVHGSLTIDPGLVRINMDYGWIRAAEALRGSTVAEQALTRSIIAARRRIWEIERDQLDPSVPHDERELLLLTRLKLDLRKQLAEVPEGVLPDGWQEWSRSWEAHHPAVDRDPSWPV